MDICLPLFTGNIFFEGEGEAGGRGGKLKIDLARLLLPLSVCLSQTEGYNVALSNIESVFKQVRMYVQDTIILLSHLDRWRRCGLCS